MPDVQTTPEFFSEMLLAPFYFENILLWMARNLETMTQTPTFASWLGFISLDVSFPDSSHSDYMTLSQKDSQSVSTALAALYSCAILLVKDPTDHQSEQRNLWSFRHCIFLSNQLKVDNLLPVYMDTCMSSVHK